MQVRVDRQCLKSIRRREIPHVVCRQVLAGRGIGYPAGLVSDTQRQSGSHPLPSEPFLGRQAVKQGALHVLDAHLRSHREFPQGLGVRVSRDVAETLVPDVATSIVPSVCVKQRVQCGPAQLRVPEPQCGFSSRVAGPSCDVWRIPIYEALYRRQIAGIAVHTVRTINNNARRRWPRLVQPFSGRKVNRDIPALVDSPPLCSRCKDQGCAT